MIRSETAGGDYAVNMGMMLQSLVSVAGRVLDGELVSEPVRCEAEDRGVVEGVQRGASAQQPGIP
jgi:hypothetical protein